MKFNSEKKSSGNREYAITEITNMHFVRIVKLASKIVKTKWTKKNEEKKKYETISSDHWNHLLREI